MDYINANLENEVLEATPYRLTQMLFERFIQLLNMGKHYIDKKDYANKSKSINKAIDIAKYLRLTLNSDDQKTKVLSSHLETVYLFAEQQLLKASINNDKVIIDNVLENILKIKSSWDEMGKKING